jgi:hypothetical protein
LTESPLKRKFAIDLRSPEELHQEHETEAWRFEYFLV